jgi:hypothetical protein
MQDAIILNAIDEDFTPKDRADRWHVSFEANTSSGYDFMLVIENPESKVSYQLEVGLSEDGRLCGQITPDIGGNGSDALVLFDMTPDIARVSGNRGGAQLIISIDDKTGPTVIEAAKVVPRRGFY